MTGGVLLSMAVLWGFLVFADYQKESRQYQEHSDELRMDALGKIAEIARENEPKT